MQHQRHWRTDSELHLNRISFNDVMVTGFDRPVVKLQHSTVIKNRFLTVSHGVFYPIFSCY